MLHLRDFIHQFIMWSSIIIFCFTLFRFRLYTYRHQLMLTATIMATTGFIIPMLHLTHYRPLMYAVISCICIAAFFRIHYSYAIVMVLSTYAFTTCSWFVIKLVLNWLSYQRPIKLAEQIGAWWSILRSIYMLSAAMLLRRMRIGFTFIPRYPQPDPQSIPLWIKITLSLGCLSILLRAASNSIWKELKPLDTGISFLLLIVLFYFIYKKETSD